MKKVFSLFFILSTLVFFSNIILADKFDDELEFKLYDISDTSESNPISKINWDTKKIVPGTDQWVWSTTYAKVKTKSIPTNVVYYMYQNNKEGSTY